MTAITTLGLEGHGEALRILQTELARAEEVLQELVAPGGSALGGALSHLARCGGKRLRSLLTLASAHAVTGASAGDAPARAVQAAAATEILHAGTLCHDDVMDEADSRRGAPSVNAKWGNSVAILCGDVLIARAIRTVARLGPAETTVLVGTLEELCEGQVRETATLFDVGRTREEYLRTVELKTASLFAAACQLGALTAGADDDTATVFARFGTVLGTAFQIVDDVLDLVGSEELLGKPAGSDLREGVLTLPVIDALGEAPQLRAILSRPLPDRDVQRSREIVLGTGAVERAVVTAREQVGEAKRLMQDVSGVDTRYVGALVTLAESVLRRGLTGLPSSATDLGELSPPLIDPAEATGPARTAGADPAAGGGTRGG